MVRGFRLGLGWSAAALLVAVTTVGKGGEKVQLGSMCTTYIYSVYTDDSSSKSYIKTVYSEKDYVVLYLELYF